VVTISEVAEQWGLAHAHDGLVHEITRLLDHCGLVECGPRQIGMAMLRLAPTGSDVTCQQCLCWHARLSKWRIEAEVFRITRDLLESLTNLVDLAELRGSLHEYEAALGIARAAIAKARGEA